MAPGLGGAGSGGPAPGLGGAGSADPAPGLIGVDGSSNGSTQDAAFGTGAGLGDGAARGPGFVAELSAMAMDPFETMASAKKKEGIASLVIIAAPVVSTGRLLERSCKTTCESLPQPSEDRSERSPSVTPGCGGRDTVVSRLGEIAPSFVGPVLAVLRGMRWKIPCLLAVSLFMGCVGPEQHVRGGRRGGFGGGHPRDPVGGFLALLEGVAAIADIAADVSATQAALDSPQRAVVVASPPDPEVRPLPVWFQGRVLLPSTHATLPEIRLGVRPLAGGSFVAIFYSDSLGRFSFAMPPAGNYTLVVLDPEYQGETRFATDGRTAFPLELPISPRPQRVPSASATPAAL